MPENKSNLTFYGDKDMIALLRQSAKDMGVSLNAFINFVLTLYLYEH